MNVLAIIVTYYPDRGLLGRCVASFVEDVAHLIIWENTPAREAEAYRFVEESAKIEYAGEGTNSGISRALNYAWKYAVSGGYDFLLTMDQDSRWTGFDKFVSHIAENAPKGIYGPRYNQLPFPETFRPTENLITSGMMVPTWILNDLGGYCEDFKVDAVDTDFICHAMSEGFKLYYVSDCELHHRIGNKEMKSFLGRKFTVPGYSPDRLYGIYRNYHIVMRKYPQIKSLRKQFRRIWVRQNPVRILLGETNRMKKLKAMISGTFAGLFCRHFGQSF